MKNKINPAAYVQIFTECLTRLACLHDLPEILNARITEKEGTTAKILGAEIPITPRGQISLIVSKMDFHASICFFDEKPLFRLKTTLSYEHVGGGSNGKSVDFLGSFETRYKGGEAVVTSLVEEGSWHRLYREMSAV